MAGFTCAPVNPARGVTGNYCLPIRVTSCSALRPYFEGATVTTASGTSANICRSRTTTCEAVLMHSAASVMGADRCTNAAPAGTSDAACGAAGINDGLCRVSSGGDNLCTYGCGTDIDCPGGFACVTDATVPVFGKRCAI
jgi:hypothetical protein